MIRTRCPACLTVFRVRPEQLQARGGHVRCGHCFRPFDARAHAMPDDAPEHDEGAGHSAGTEAPVPPPRAETPQNRPDPRPDESQPPAAEPAAPEALDTPSPATSRAELDALLEFTIPDSFGPKRHLPEASETGYTPDTAAQMLPDDLAEAHTSEETDPFPERRMRPGEDHLPSFEERLAALSLRGPDEPIESDGAADLTGDAHDTEREHTAVAEDGEDLPLVVPAAIRRRRTAADAEPPDLAHFSTPAQDTAVATNDTLELPEAWRRPEDEAPDTDAKEFFTTQEEAPADTAAWDAPAARSERRGLWGLGIGILLGMLVIQATYVMREPIARHWPHTRPLLELACEQVGCEVPFARHANEILIDHSHLEMALPGSRVYVLEARVRNRASYPQAYPYLEVTLTDMRDRPLARRVLEPADWLTAAGADERAFPARGEVHVMLPFAAPDVEDASGYRLYAFYP